MTNSIELFADNMVVVFMGTQCTIICNNINIVYCPLTNKNISRRTFVRWAKYVCTLLDILVFRNKANNKSCRRCRLWCIFQCFHDLKKDIFHTRIASRSAINVNCPFIPELVSPQFWIQLKGSIITLYSLFQ